MLWFLFFEWICFCDLFVFSAATIDRDGSGGEYDERVWRTVQQWAPKVWLEPGERFFPSTVAEFIPKVTPARVNCTDCAFPSPAALSGQHSSDYYLMPNEDLESLLNNTTSFVYGKSPKTSSVSIYAFVSSCDPHYDHFIITYWFFYPYNEGKEFCSFNIGKSKSIPLLNIFKKCLGKAVRFGNHLGDWERMSLEIVNWVPRKLFLSVHNVGVYYLYDKASNMFIVTSTLAQGLSQVTEPPLTIQVIDGHPVLFAAKGSHALWGTTGVHKYTKLQLSQLVDSTGYGVSWDTWRDIHIYPEQGVGTPDWYNYQGRWGPPRTQCLSLPRLGKTKVCQFSDGPEGLSLRTKDFTCSKSGDTFKVKVMEMLRKMFEKPG